MQSEDPKSLQLKDVVSLIDVASAEISYEKESGLRAILQRPRDVPPLLLSPQHLEMYVLLREASICLYVIFIGWKLTILINDEVN